MEKADLEKHCLFLNKNMVFPDNVIYDNKSHMFLKSYFNERNIGYGV